MTVSSDRPRMPDEPLCPLNLKRRAAEMLRAATNIRPEDWRVERDLSMTKWFDYRFLTPLEATLQFVEDYQFVYRNMWKSNFDAATADLKRGTAGKGLFADRREFSTFWNARVCADTQGVRYPFFINTTMEVALRRGKWKRLPRPGQLWNKADCLAAVEAKWEEELAGRQAVSALAHYRPENFLGLPHQLDHQQHALRVAKKRSNFLGALGNYIDIDRIVSAAQAEAAYDTPVMTMAREAVSSSAAPAPQDVLPLDQLLPSCFGLPVAVDRALPLCAACPLIDRCAMASGVAQAASAKRNGADPVADHKRALSRERSRRYRERGRASRDAAGAVSGSPTQPGAGQAAA